MVTNSSVLDEYSPNVIVEDIRMQSNQAINESKIFVLVEGDDDVKAYKRFFNSEVVELSVAGNCMHVKDAIEIAFADKNLKNKVIGIKDSDFDKLKNVDYSYVPTLFLTDTHDAETMMLTDRCIKTLAIETTSREIPSLLRDAISILEPFSYIRYYNDVESQNYGYNGICFDGFSLTNYNPKVEIKSIEFWLQKLKLHQNNQFTVTDSTIKKILQFSKDNKVSKADSLLLVNGHDMVYVIRDLLYKFDKKAKQYGDKNIAQIIRTSYSFEEFCKTNLYKRLNEWANKQNLNMWVA